MHCTVSMFWVDVITNCRRRRVGRGRNVGTRQGEARRTGRQAEGKNGAKKTGRKGKGEDGAGAGRQGVSARLTLLPQLLPLPTG